jgi:hypothetical protein
VAASLLFQVVEQHYVRRNEVNDWSRDTVVVSRICREVPWYLVRASYTCPLQDQRAGRSKERLVAEAGWRRGVLDAPSLDAHAANASHT